MVAVDHVEKVALSKVTVTAPAPVKEEQGKPEAEGKRAGRKAKDE